LNRYWLETLGCPKNQVDGDKLAHRLEGGGYRRSHAPEDADLVVVNTCAFIEAARQESIEAVLEAAAARRPGARLVVTGCLAERYGDELARALPEVDLVAGFGHTIVPEAPPEAPVPVRLTRRAVKDPVLPASSFDLLELPRGPAEQPWAYVKVAEGCDRRCGFCAIPSFRGPQRSRRSEDIVREVADLVEGGARAHGGVREIVLVAQDLASYGRDRSEPGRAARRGAVPPIVRLLGEVDAIAQRTRLLYLYPSSLTDPLVEAVVATGVPYFDLSLQHVSRPLLAKMRRFGDGSRFLDRIESIRRLAPDATLRSSFILGYPGETEEDHDRLLAFLEDAQLDWAGFFPFSREEGTAAAGLPDQVPEELAIQRLRECAEIQDAITERRRRALVGRRLEVLVDRPGRARSVHEAPEIDGIVQVPEELPVGSLVTVEVSGSAGPDLWARPFELRASA